MCSEYCGLILCLLNSKLILTIQGVTELAGKCYELICSSICSDQYLILS